MHLYDYQQQAQRTMNNAPIECWCMGLTGEAGELVDYLKKVLYHGHPLDKKRVKEELGDVLWYVSAIATYYNLDLDIIAQDNISKLRKRYPNGWDKERSVNR